MAGISSPFTSWLPWISVAPRACHPFAGLGDQTRIADDHADLPLVPGIGFELNRDIVRAFADAFG